MDNQLIITFVTALIAGLSFVAFALPFLNRSDKKERFNAIIEKRRKDLFQASRDGSMHKAKTEDLSAKESMAGFYKVQKVGFSLPSKVPYFNSNTHGVYFIFFGNFGISEEVIGVSFF